MLFFFSEQQTNVQLQNDIRNIDNTVESHGDILLQYNELKNQKIALEKEYLALQDNFFTLKDEVMCFLLYAKNNDIQIKFAEI